MRCFKLKISTGYVGADHEDTVCYTDEELQGMAESEIDTMLHEALTEFAANVIDSWWEEVEPESD